MPRVKNNVARIPINGISGDAFVSGTLQFSHLDRTFRTGEDLLLRKRPGRAKGHQLVIPAGVAIPEPERSIDITVNLYDGSNTLVASGTDTVAPPGLGAAIPNPERITAHLDKMLATIEEIQGMLQYCKGELCHTVLEHSFLRMDYTKNAKSAVEAGEYAAATEYLESVKRIVEGDIELLEDTGESDLHRDVLALERDLLAETNDALAVMPGDNVSSA